MFTQSCFIRKNRPSIRHKLSTILKYKPNELDDFKLPWLAANYGRYISVEEGYLPISSKEIDCGTNKDLFFALAALRDDSDKYQWFVCGDEPLDWWVKCDADNKKDDTIMWYDCLFNEFHKATVEELIEHFKKRE